MRKLLNSHQLLIITGLFVLVPIFVFSQINKQEKPIWKKDTVIGTNIFQLTSNWFSISGGWAINSVLPKDQFAGSADFSFHIKKEYFQTGIFISGDAFGTYNNYQFHLGYGKRYETTKLNFSYFGGPSYAIFFEWDETKFKQGAVNDVGLYLSTQLIRKIKFDVGIGGSLFANINSHQTIVGAKLDVYLSGAYKGKKN